MSPTREDFKRLEKIILERLNDGRGRAVHTKDGIDICTHITPEGVPCAVGAIMREDLRRDIPASMLDVCVSAGGWYGEGEGADLAEVLNASNIPASREMRIFLMHWQDRHDDEAHWQENTYTGPKDSIIPGNL